MHKYPHVQRIKAHTNTTGNITLDRYYIPTSGLAPLLNEYILFNKENILQIQNDLQIFKKQALTQISTIPHNQPLCLNWTPHTLLKPQFPCTNSHPPPPTHTQLPTNLTGVPGLVHGIWWHHSLFLPGILNPAALPLHTATISMATSPPPASLLASRSRIHKKVFRSPLTTRPQKMMLSTGTWAKFSYLGFRVLWLRKQRNVLLPTFHPSLNPTLKWLLHLFLSGPQPKAVSAEH